MTADDDSCSSYDSVSAIALPVGNTNSVTDTSTDIDTSSCDPDDAFYCQQQVLLLHLLLILLLIQTMLSTNNYE